MMTTTVFVSARRNTEFYINLCTKYFENTPKITLKACGIPTTTAIIASDVLLHRNRLTRSIETETEIQKDGNMKTQLTIYLYPKDKDKEKAFTPLPVKTQVIVTFPESVMYWLQYVFKFLELNEVVTVSGYDDSISILITLYEILKNNTHLMCSNINTNSRKSKTYAYFNVYIKK